MCKRIMLFGEVLAKYSNPFKQCFLQSNGFQAVFRRSVALFNMSLGPRNFFSHLEAVSAYPMGAASNPYRS